MSNLNKLCYSQIYEHKFSKSSNKYDKSKKINYKNENNFEKDIDKNYISVMFKGRKLKIKKKPRQNSNDVKINLKYSNLKNMQMIINSKNKEKNKEILYDENEKNLTQRKRVVEQYKNLLKKLNFSPSQKFYHSQIREQNEQIIIKRINKEENDKQIINKTEEKINIKLLNNEKIIHEINSEKKKKNLQQTL